MTKDHLFEIYKKSIDNAISVWKDQGLSEEEINEKITQDKLNSSMQSMFETASKDCFSDLINKKYEIAFFDSIREDKFLAHHHEIWGECFVTSQTMYSMAIEAAEMYSNYIQENIPEDAKADKQYTYCALQRIHGRSCQVFLEILCLIKHGFADCAFARWRSMYELSCIAAFIRKYGEHIAKQYCEQAHTEKHKYEWAKGAKDEKGETIIINSFKDIQDNCELDEEWRKEYKLASFIIHGSPQGTFLRIGNFDSQNLICVGQSDYGIEAPAVHSAISLQWVTALFLTVFPCLDALVSAKVIQDWTHEVQKLYYSTADECFGKTRLKMQTGK